MRRASPLRAPLKNICNPCRSALVATGIVCAFLAAFPMTDAVAQTPGLPVLQGPFTSPGRGLGVNYGDGDAFSAIAVAASWTPATNRFQVSAGVGGVSPDGISRRGVGIGARVAVPVRTRWTDSASALGAAVFGGVGGARWSGAGELRVPVGVSLAYRMRLGETRAVAAYVAPYFQWSRRTGDRDAGRIAPAEDGDEGDDRQDSDLARAAVGVDVTLTRRVSLSLGYDLGEDARDGRPGPTSGILGVGVGWSF